MTLICREMRVREMKTIVIQTKVLVNPEVSYKTNWILLVTPPLRVHIILRQKNSTIDIIHLPFTKQ
jgi:hypothetical protein